MFDIGILEFVTIAVVALLVFGPDRLPKVTAQATHWLRQLREQAQSARQSISDSIDIDQSMLKDLSDLHPRNIARTVLEPVNEARAPIDEAVLDAQTSANPSPPPSSTTHPKAPPQVTPAFDPDAT